MSKFRFLHIREQDYIRQINCHQHSTEGDVSHSVPVPLFSWTFLMAHSKAILKRNDDKASSFRPFWIGSQKNVLPIYAEFTISFVKTHFA